MFGRDVYTLLMQLLNPKLRYESNCNVINLYIITLTYLSFYDILPAFVQV